MILCIDSGNSSVKAAVFNQNKEIIKQVKTTVEDFDFTEFHDLNIAGICISNVGISSSFNLPENIPIVEVSHELKFPFTLEYKTPLTLGADRLALMAGAIQLFPNNNKLIIDSGTCITFDVLTSSSVYKGGVISPGLDMRLNAMHHFTGKLPQVKAIHEIAVVGNSTASCMQSGALNGLLFEIEGFINAFQSEFSELKTIITGGNAQLLAKQIHNTIFAEPNLLLNGLYHIYKINVG